MRRYTESKTKKRMSAEDRKEAILETTVSFISQFGFWGFTIRDVAQAEGFGRGGGCGDGIAYHCDLGLKAISTGTVETNAGRPEMVRLYTLLESEALSKDHPVHEYFEQREINLLKEYTFAAKRDGVADPERTALQVLSAMEGLQLRWLNGSHDIDFVGEWKALIGLLIP